MDTTRTLPRPALRWATVGLAAGLLASALLGTAATSVAAQSDLPTSDTIRILSVSGTGRVNAAPDVADINLGVIERGKEAANASQKAAESMDSVVQALLGLGIDEKDIQTTSLSLNPQYDWNTDPATVVGWEASNSVTVTVRAVDTVGDIVDTAVKAGANQVNGITFRIEDPTDAEALARTAAVDDARAKADQLAGDAGVEIVGIVSITESGGQQPQPIYMDRAELAMAADTSGAGTPVLEGEVELSVTVLIQYEIA